MEEMLTATTPPCKLAFNPDPFLINTGVQFPGFHAGNCPSQVHGLLGKFYHPGLRPCRWYSHWPHVTILQSPPITLSNAATVTSSPWHFLSNSVCPSVVCLSGIVECPFCVDVCIFSHFFLAILQTSLLFDCPIYLCLSPPAPRTCCEGFRNCRETQGLISLRVSPCFQANVHLGVCRADECLLRKTQKGMAPLSHINFKPQERRHSYSEVWVWICYRKGQHFFFVVLSKSTNNTDKCLFRL